MAHDARGKAHDVEEKLKKKKGGIFSSISSLQKKNDKVCRMSLRSISPRGIQPNCGYMTDDVTVLAIFFQFSSRREACDIQSTKARNDYILALAAANAHQKRYYETDLRGGWVRSGRVQSVPQRSIFRSRKKNVVAPQ